MKPAQYLTTEILAARGKKSPVDAGKPYAFLVEQERAASGQLEDVATLFLTNRECPFRCLMCDLWRNTLDKSVPAGAIPLQIRYALERLPAAQHIKLYNSGNFFDAQAIPPADHHEIAELVQDFQTVIVENHPQLCGQRCVEFQKILHGQLEVALGLETIQPEILAALNKQMTLTDFDRACEFLLNSQIAVRAFILIRPPFMTDDEGVEWAVRSMEHAFERGVRVCSLIPTRAGNGIMEQLQTRGEFTPPTLTAIETAFEAGLKLGPGRVLLDTWDLTQFPGCHLCETARHQRLIEMNKMQTVLPRIVCHCISSRGRGNS